MKLSATCFVVILAAATAIPVLQKSLGDDLKEFQNLIPFEKVKNLLVQYFIFDAELQEFVEFVQSDEIIPVFEEIEAIPSVREFLAYLHNHGSDIYELLSRLHNALGLNPYKPMVIKAEFNSNGLAGLFQELKSLLPLEELKAMYEMKLQSSQDFREFVDYLKSPKFQNLVNEVLANQRVQKVIKFLTDKHVNLSELSDLVGAFLGIQHKLF